MNFSFEKIYDVLYKNFSPENSHFSIRHISQTNDSRLKLCLKFVHPFMKKAFVSLQRGPGKLLKRECVKIESFNCKKNR